MAEWPRKAVSTHSGETLRPKAVISTCLRRPRTCRKPRMSRAFDSRAMSISAPSSTPCGCGLISVASLGTSSVARGKVSDSLPAWFVPARCAAPTGRT